MNARRLQSQTDPEAPHGGERQMIFVDHLSRPILGLLRAKDPSAVAQLGVVFNTL